MSCPRHGRGDIDLPGLRCDCPNTVLAAVAPLKGGKWVRAAVMGVVVDEWHSKVNGVDFASTSVNSEEWLGDVVEARARQAIEEAVMAGYRLGLQGGVAPGRVRTCLTCKETFLVKSADSDAVECLSCCVVKEG